MPEIPQLLLWGFVVESTGTVRSLHYLVDRFGAEIAGETQNENGDRLVQVRIHGNAGNDGADSGDSWTLDVWINKDRDFLVDKWRKEVNSVLNEDGKEKPIVFRTSEAVQEFASLPDGSWFPEKLLFTNGSSLSGRSSGAKVDIKDFHVNETPSSRLHDFRFASNALVKELLADGREVRVHVWGFGGPKQSFTEGPEVGKFLLDTCSGRATSGRTQDTGATNEGFTLAHFGWGILGLLLILASAYLAKLKGHGANLREDAETDET